MKYIKSFAFLLAFGILFGACETFMVERIDEFNLEKGGYMRIVSPFPTGSQTFNTLFRVSEKNMSGTKLDLIHEAVTPESGANFDKYDLEIRYVGATAATTTTFVALKSVASSEYKADPTTGYPRHNFTVTGAEALTATKLDTAATATGRWFEVRGTMRLKDGRSFNAANTGANITGGAFYSSPFLYRINIDN